MTRLATRSGARLDDRPARCEWLGAPAGDGILAHRVPDVPGFRVSRPVGQGRTSTAWLAQDLRLGRDVVLKILNPEVARDSARQASFAQEFAVASQIRSPHVIRVFDRFTAGGHSCISAEHLEGGDLRGRIGRGIAAAQALSLLRQAALALAELHRRGLVHCDIKPANLLLRATGELVLADFGLVRRAGECRGAGPGMVFGTPCYAAPEQTGGAAAHPSADVYSLGAVFCEMLCGAPPFSGTTALEQQCQHLMADLPRLPTGLSRFQPLLDSILDKDAARRLPDAAAVLRAIDSIESPDRARRSKDGASASRC